MLPEMYIDYVCDLHVNLRTVVYHLFFSNLFGEKTRQSFRGDLALQDNCELPSVLSSANYPLMIKRKNRECKTIVSYHAVIKLSMLFQNLCDFYALLKPF